MSWDNVINRGSGQVEFRLAFEGLPYEAVSDPAMVRRRPTVRGESGWSASNYYSHTTGVDGSDTMVRAALVRVDAVPSVTTEVIFSDGSANSAGWQITWTAGSDLHFRASNGAAVTSPGYTITSSDVGKVLLLVGTLGGGAIGFEVNGTSLGSNSFSGSFVGSAGADTAIGAYSNAGGNDPASSFTILACAASDSVSTVGDADDYWEACKDAGDLASFTGIEGLWSVRQTSSLAFDLVGSVGFTKNGTPTLEDDFAADYDDEDGRERIAGLDREGLVLEEQGDLASATMESGGFTVTIVDDQGKDRWTELFSKTPSVRTYLTADAGIAATTFTVESTTGVTAGDHLYVGTETIKVGTVASSTSLTGCSRARHDSIAQKHWTESGDRLAYPEVTDWPTTIERRRAWLYAYGEGDSRAGNGTLIWRGICYTDAKLNGDGSSWSISIDPITALFDQDLGVDLDEPTQPRGIYYPGNAPFRATLIEYTTSSPDTPSDFVSVYVVGHYETNADFCDALNTKIDAATSGFTVAEIRAVPEGDEGWHFEYTTDNASAKWIGIQVRSLVDGRLLNPTEQLYNKSTGVTVASVATDTAYGYRWTLASVPGERTVPRGVFNRPSTGGLGLDEDEEEVTTTEVANNPDLRVYMGGRFSVSSSIDAAIVETTDGSGNRSLQVDTVGASDRYINFRDERGPSGDFGFIYTRTIPATFQFTRRYAEGTLADFRTAITDLAQLESNKGTVPFITASDWASIASVVDEAREGRRVGWRKYTATQSINLWEHIQHEARLLGCFWRLNSTGALQLAKLRVPVATVTAASDIAETEVLIDGGYPEWEKNADGTVNVVELKTGYDPVEDEFLGTTFIVRDVQSISHYKRSYKLEIHPKSEAIGTAFYEDVVDLAQTVFGVYGGDYAVVTVEVPFKLFSVLVGDFVTITHKNLPDPETGKRGLSNRPALVIGRRWDLDQGRGTFRLLVPFDNLAGYAPSVSVSSASGSGTAWTLTVSTNDPLGDAAYFETGDVLSDHFGDGMRIRLMQWNNASPTVRVGEIDAAGVDDSAGTIAVTLDSSWTGLGGNDYVLGYDEATAAVTAAQRAYAFLADTDARINFSTETPARQYAA